MLTVYGIKNCDTVKKALKWLDANAIDYRFQDYRSEPVDAAILQRWLDTLGSKTLVNRSSTSWRQLDEQSRSAIDRGEALAALRAHPTLIKRPVLEGDGILHVGFKEEDYAGLLKA